MNPSRVNWAIKDEPPFLGKRDIPDSIDYLSIEEIVEIARLAAPYQKWSNTCDIWRDSSGSQYTHIQIHSADYRQWYITINHDLDVTVIDSQKRERSTCNQYQIQRFFQELDIKPIFT